MKRLLILFLTCGIGVQLSLATTYFKNWVNGNESDTLVQGDIYAWEYDLSVVGGSANLKIILDVNKNQIYDDSDQVLTTFIQTDGEIEEDGPSDSSDVPDGIIYLELGPFYFAPADYIFLVEDLNDYSSVTGFLHIDSMPDVSVWITGKLSIEGIIPPDARLANFMFEATAENEDFPIVSGLTDENGDFKINMPDYAVGLNFKIGYMFENQISGYQPDSISYHNQLIDSGANGPFIFNLFEPDAIVYGSVLDENDQLVPVSGWGSIENLTTYQEIEFNIIDGSYQTAAPFATSDSISGTFQLHFWSEALIPNYMIPNTWDNPYYTFNLIKGDSLEKNIYVLSTDTVIYVKAEMDGAPLAENYQVWASNDQIGQSFVHFNGQSIVQIPVRSGNLYNVNLVNTDYHDLQLPPGYYLENGNWREAWPGDTVFFNIVAAKSKIVGHLFIDKDDSLFGDLNSCQVQAFANDWQIWYDGKIHWDSLRYSISVPNDTFDVRFRCWDWKYLAKPDLYENVIVNNDTVKNLNFTLNYAHATLEVHLRNAHMQEPGTIYHQISTLGAYPDVYVTEAQMQTDTSFYFNVCDGQWVINAPYVNTEYIPDADQKVVSVIEDSSYYYVEFVYHLNTGIQNKPIIPKDFYVKQNYPNPFNPVTTIEFGLPKKQEVSVTIYNIYGQKVSCLFKGTLSAGIHKLHWNATNFASGIYFYQVLTKNKNSVKRMVLIK